MENRNRQPLLLAALIIILAGALWLAPRLVSQAQLRAWAEPQLERALQRGVSVEGEIHLTLLPRPMLIANDVKFSQDGRNVASAPQVEASLQLLPLLLGRLRPEELRLRQATLDWGGGPALTAVDAALSLSGDSILLKGHAQWRDLGFALAASSGPGGREAAVHFDHGGEIALRLPQTPAAPGRLSVKLPDLAALDARLPAIPASATADLQWQEDDIAADNLQAVVGDVDWHGKARVTPSTGPRVELSLRSTLADLDRLKNPAVALAPAALALVPGIAAEVGIGIDQMIWRGKALQDVRLSLQSVHGETSIRSANVTLPGNSEVALAGTIAAGPRLEGSFEAKSDDLRQLLRWAGIEPEGVPADRLHVARLAGDVKASADEISLERVRLKFDSSLLDLSATYRPGPKPALGLSFALDSLNADAYWPQKRKSAVPPPIPAEGGAAQPAAASALDADVSGRIGRLSWRGAVARDLALAARWNGESMDAKGLSASAATLDFGKTRLDSVKADLAFAGDRVSFDHLSASLYGGELSGAGTLVPDSGAFTLHLALAQAQMRQALLDAADIGLADGVLEGETDLASAGHVPAELQAHLNGSARLSVRDGLIRGFDLKAADRALAEKPGIGGLIALLQAGLTGGATRFSLLSGSARITDGVIVSDDLKLQADGGFAAGAARVDLLGDSVDAHADFRFQSAADAPPLVMRLTGPLQSPRRFLDVKPLQQWLAEHGVKGAKPKDVLKGLLQGLVK
jgi:hypothetical protein